MSVVSVRAVGRKVIRNMELYNLEHEIKFISAIIHDPACIDDIYIKPEDLYDQKNIKILKAVHYLVAKGQKPDISLIYDHTKIDGSYLAKIEPVTSANVKYYADSIRHFSRVRAFKLLAQTIFDNLNNKKEHEDVINEIERAITQISTENSNSIESLAELLPRLVDELEERNKNKGKLWGIPTGFSKLDQLTGGLQKGEFIVIGSRPSIGKTALALSISRNAATKGHKVGFFSLEQSQSPMRLLASEARVNIGNMRSGYLAEGHFHKLMDAANKMYNYKIYFDNNSSLFSDIRSNARKMVRKMDVEIIMIDYITLIQYGKAAMNMFERIGEISHGLKSLSHELNIPLVALSQLRRETEERRPTLADLRMSGEIEQDADVVIFLHRDRKVEDGITVVDVAKQRNGPVDEFKIKFLPEFVRFEDVQQL